MTFNNPAIIADGPLVYVPGYFDQAGSNGYTDYVGAAHLNVASGSTISNYQSGPKGNPALTWGTQGGYAQSSSSITSPSTATVEAFVKFNATPATNMAFLSISPTSGTVGPLGFTFLSTGIMRFFCRSGSTNFNADSSGTVSTGVWHHVVGSIGAAGMKLRIDKTTVGTNTATSLDSSGTAVFPTVRSYWNGSGFNSVTLPMNIGEIAVFSSQLTDARTDAHYDSPGVLSGSWG